MNRPNYLGIGAIKAGTTWAADILDAHPEVFMVHGKELHYFSHNYQRGLDWYLNKFKSGNRALALGEFSVTYMNGSRDVAERIFQFDPAIKLIVSVRNPVERAFSQFRWEKQMGEDLPSFSESLKIRPDLISNSCYASNLAPFWDLFPANQFFYIRELDIRNNPESVCRELYEFLGVDAGFSPEKRDEIVGQTIQPTSQLLESMRIKTHKAAMKYGLEGIVTLYRKLGLSRVYRKLNNDEGKRESLSEEDRCELESLFAEDMKEFKLKTGMNVC